MNYLTHLLDECEFLREKRIPSELYSRLLGNMQRIISLTPSVMCCGCASQSEMILMHCALNYAAEHNGENITVAQAAKRLGTQTSSVSRLLRSLSQKGFIERYSDPDDRRAVRIKVTQKGEDELKRVLKNIFTVFDKAMCDFSDEDIKKMIELHGRFTEAISKVITEGGAVNVRN
ncbi:MAG: MarR family transcriptional regulator [Ruminococcaceae bacterium]|nr:MarR family transcriptional regulator [Oscillospiraceae bacterium]